MPFQDMWKGVMKLLPKISKAIAGTIAGFLVVMLAKFNIVIADDLNDSLEMILGAIITGLVVYFAPKNTGGR